jgi:hypothetical protein
MSNLTRELLNKKEEIYNRISEKLELNASTMNGGSNMLINNGNIVMANEVLHIDSLPTRSEAMKILTNKNKGISVKDFMNRYRQ